MNFFKKLFSKREKDLVIGDEPEAENEVVVDWFAQRAEARADIDTAVSTYNFLDEVDSEGPDILKWNLKRKHRRAKRQCLEIIYASINDLTYEPDEEEEDEE